MKPSVLQVIDSHTEGEPTRLVYDGFPLLHGKTLKDKLNSFKQDFDHLRRALILEPRGHEVLVGALLCEPEHPDAATGVIFFNNEGYLGMCGHGTIGLIASLYHLNKIGLGKHLIETPVGIVECVLHEDGAVSVRNVPSYRYRQAVELHVPELGKITGDIAWGGNWFFLVSDHGQEVSAGNIDALTDAAWKIRLALEQAGITGENGQIIDHIELFADTPYADSRSFVLCPGKAYDRSPCGTGTSAKLACLAADGILAPNTAWVQESVIGSKFTASYEPAGDGKIVPTIRGRAYVYAEAKIILAENDPFCYGITQS